MSQIWRGCRKDLKRKTQNLLEWAENRRNFASSIRNNDASPTWFDNVLWLTDTDIINKVKRPQHPPRCLTHQFVPYWKRKRDRRTKIIILDRNCSFHKSWLTSRLTLKVTHHVTQSYFKKAYKNKKDQESFWFSAFSFLSGLLDYQNDD